jgi:nucleotide-binding universal stress UspA family protein
MTPIRTILHPTDFSASSEAALGLACSLAHSHAARLIILHVVTHDLTNHWDALSQFQDRVVGQSPGFPVETCLREGAPAEEILRAADEVGADLVVMGSHGRTGLSRLLMGSVAETVMRRAGCPVLLSRRPVGAASTDANQATPAPDDATPDSGRVIVIERLCGCGIRNTHVIHRDFPEYWAEGGTASEGASSLEAKLTQAREDCCGGDWHYNDLSRAIDEVRDFRAAMARAGEPAVRESRVKATSLAE